MCVARFACSVLCPTLDFAARRRSPASPPWASSRSAPSTTTTSCSVACRVSVYVFKASWHAPRSLTLCALGRRGTAVTSFGDMVPNGSDVYPRIRAACAFVVMGLLLGELAFKTHRCCVTEWRVAVPLTPHATPAAAAYAHVTAAAIAWFPQTRHIRRFRKTNVAISIVGCRFSRACGMACRGSRNQAVIVAMLLCVL